MIMFSLLLLLLLLFLITFMTIIHLQQTIFLGYMVLQLFCSYNSWHMSRIYYVKVLLLWDILLCVSDLTGIF